MNLIAGIVIAVIGFVVAVLGILKVVPGVTSTGVFLLLLSGLVGGLSFVSRPETEGADRMSTAETLAAIFYAPADVFRNLRRHPRWLAATIIVAVLATTYSLLFFQRLTPERIVNYTVDKTLQMEMIKSNEEARKGVEESRGQQIADAKNPVQMGVKAVGSFIGYVFLFAFLGAVLMVTVIAFGGRINYWQAFSVAVYATFPVSVIRLALSSVILYLKDPVDIHPILGQQSLVQDNLGFLLTPADNPVLFTLVSSLSLLTLYWVWLTAVGLKNSGERVTPTAAWTAPLLLTFLLIFFGVAMASLFPDFIS